MGKKRGGGVKGIEKGWMAGAEGEGTGIENRKQIDENNIKFEYAMNRTSLYQLPAIMTINTAIEIDAALTQLEGTFELPQF